MLWCASTRRDALPASAVLLTVLALIAASPASAAGLQCLYTFSALSSERFNSDGANPYSGLAVAPDGTLYGTACSGGAAGFGTIFKLRSDGTGFQTIAYFNCTNGAGPNSGLTLGPDGSLYGTASGGGMSGYGTVFRVHTDGSRFQTLVNFDARNGADPLADLTFAPDGSLYGTTSQGGRNRGGTAFKVQADGTRFRTPVNFGLTANGSGPSSRLIIGHDGYVYGATYRGGPSGYGTIFKVRTDGRRFKTLVSFASAKGEYPNGVTFGPGGDLYGTTSHGGNANVGTVFKLRPNGKGFRTLVNFSSTTGSVPLAPLTIGTDGALYGRVGAINSDAGTVFKVRVDGTGFQTLVTFASGDGANAAPLIPGHDGSLYGSASEAGAHSTGTIFRIVL